MQQSGEVKITGQQRRLIKQMQREKPPAHTIVKRPTAKNLAYLRQHELVAELVTDGLAVPKSSRRRRGDGTFVQDHAPTHGV